MNYIALLRGINVGGNNKISMPELKAAFQRAGFTEVSTYINSGNVLFSSGETDVLHLMEVCHQLIQDAFGLDIAVNIVSADELLEALQNAPDWWNAAADAKHNAMFVIPPASAEDIMGEVGAIKPEYEKVGSHGQVIFWSAPIQTFSHTRWSKVVGTRAYASITIRNANTALKLGELARRHEEKP